MFTLFTGNMEDGGSPASASSGGADSWWLLAAAIWEGALAQLTSGSAVALALVYCGCSSCTGIPFLPGIPNIRCAMDCHGEKMDCIILYIHIGSYVGMVINPGPLEWGFDMPMTFEDSHEIG